MSRCFPYPPPGYELKKMTTTTRVVNDDLDLGVIESIESEREKTKKERKEEKKRLKEEKKERKREKKEKRTKEKSWEIGECSRTKKPELDYKEEETIKKGAEEIEQVEKSCLTEEQLASAQNLYDSSDSTQNSNKRKRHSSPSNRNHSSGSSIVIRLPLPKHKDPETPPIKEYLSSISGRTGIVAHKEAGILPRPSNQQGCSTSGRTEVLVQDQAVTALTSSLFKNGTRAQDSPFSNLIENWVPPTIPQSLDFDDQEWLFDSKQRRGSEAKRFKHSEADLCQSSSSSSLWPRACYLPSADMYILPYTVPF